MATRTPAKKTPAKKTTPRRTAVKAAPEPDPVELDDIDAVDEQELKDLARQMDFRPSPNPKVLDLIPDELKFSTDSGERRDPETIAVEINGRPHYLYQPSTAMLMLMLAPLAVDNTPLEKRIAVMMDVVTTCIDSEGAQVIRRAIMANDDSFDLTILPKLVTTVLNKWAPSMASNYHLDVDDEPAGNRAARRSR